MKSWRQAQILDVVDDDPQIGEDDPAVTVLMARLLFGEHLTGLQVLGLCLALASVAFFSIP